MQPYDAPTQFPSDEMNISSIPAATDFENWAASSGLSVLETRSLYCDDLVCNRYENDQWLFSDDDHLSVDGAKKLIPLFREILSGSQ